MTTEFINKTEEVFARLAVLRFTGQGTEHRAVTQGRGEHHATGSEGGTHAQTRTGALTDKQ